MKSKVAWIAFAKDPRFKRPYTELVYQPMLIDSGGGIEFMRSCTEQICGIPAEQVVGVLDQDGIPNQGWRPDTLSLAKGGFH